MNLAEHIEKHPSLRALFGEAILKRWGHLALHSDDRKAAAQLHIQIVSRITTQRLGYLDGVEASALDSIYALFAETREIATRFPDARIFETAAWHVLNTHVRPLTAKWHGRSQRGLLSAVDNTDEFRAELTVLQPVLRQFDLFLIQLRDDGTLQIPSEEAIGARDQKIEQEMDREVSWGIPEHFGGLDSSIALKINEEEKKAILSRRDYYKEHYESCNKPHATGLAISGGGIRSATFSLGVLIALAKREILPQIDYLSTVSGGGYLGSFLTTFLNSPKRETANEPDVGLRQVEYPFRRKEGEENALRHIRHHSKYLSGSLAERFKMMCAQLYGMGLNAVSLVFIAAIFVFGEQLLRKSSVIHGLWWPCVLSLIGILTAVAFVSPLFLRFGVKAQRAVETTLASAVAVFLVVLAWKGLEQFHQSMNTWSQPKWVGIEKSYLAITGLIPVLASAFSAFVGRLFRRARTVLVVLAAITAPLFFFAIYAALYQWASGDAIPLWHVGATNRLIILPAVIVIAALVYFGFLNINFTSPHRYYRNKLADAYLIQPSNKEKPEGPFSKGVSLKLSTAGKELPRCPYHLLNAAVNVPSSKKPLMQGRLTDFFLFSPSFCGSPVTGYEETTKWEKEDPHLDIGTAMAISGAAAAPQMGLATQRSLSFWLALLNIRLGYWVRNPLTKTSWFNKTPGLWYLLKEMMGRMDEKSPWINVSDGGHIENLGVYELLRRRCKYIIAIDGEHDPNMTFAALTTLQRLAAIDFGVRIDIDLDDLRLNTLGYSRSHFRFCRIEYPRKGRIDKSHGYLLYLKLSLTGNEGEFLRRYRIDDPAFPHDSTANQFFSEAQFEAYRSLGEHVGDKLFLRAVVGPIADSSSVEVEKWFGEIGKSFLESLPKPAAPA